MEETAFDPKTTPLSRRQLRRHPSAPTGAAASASVAQERRPPAERLRDGRRRRMTRRRADSVGRAPDRARGRWPSTRPAGCATTGAASASWAPTASAAPAARKRTSVPSVAVVGASSAPQKFGNKAVRAYLRAGLDGLPGEPQRKDDRRAAGLRARRGSARRRRALLALRAARPSGSRCWRRSSPSSRKRSISTRARRATRSSPAPRRSASSRSWPARSSRSASGLELISAPRCPPTQSTACSISSAGRRW